MEDEPGRVTRSRRRLSEEGKHEDSPKNTPTKKRAARLSMKPQLDNIVENGIETESTAPLTPLRRSRRISVEYNSTNKETIGETKTIKSAKKQKDIEPLIEENEKENTDSNSSINHSVSKIKTIISQKLELENRNDSLNVSTNIKRHSLNKSAKKDDENAENINKTVNSNDSPKMLPRRRSSRSLSAKLENSLMSDNMSPRKSLRIISKNGTPQLKKDACYLPESAEKSQSSTAIINKIKNSSQTKSPSSVNNSISEPSTSEAVNNVIHVILGSPGPKVVLAKMSQDQIKEQNLSDANGSTTEFNVEENVFMSEKETEMDFEKSDIVAPKTSLSNKSLNESKIVTENFFENPQIVKPRKSLNKSETVESRMSINNSETFESNMTLNRSGIENDKSSNKSKVAADDIKSRSGIFNSSIMGKDVTKENVSDSFNKVESIIYMEVDEDAPEVIISKNNESVLDKSADLSLNISKVKMGNRASSEENDEDPSNKAEKLNDSVNELNNYREIKFVNKDKSNSTLSTSISNNRSVLLNECDEDMDTQEPNNLNIITDEKMPALKLHKNSELSKSLQDKNSHSKISKKNVSFEELSKSTPTRIRQLKRLGLHTSTPILPKSSKEAVNVSKDKSKLDLSKNDSGNSEDDSDAISNKLFINDEAEDAGEDYESGDSLDEDEAERMKDGEIEEKGESLGSDTEEHSNDSEYEKGSFIVTSNEEDNVLLSGSEDDLGLSADELTQSAKSKKKFNTKKNKEQKRASREMYAARHSKNNESSSKFQSDSDTEIFIKVCDKKSNRIDSDDVEPEITYPKELSKNQDIADDEVEDTSVDEDSQKIIDTYENLLSNLNKSPSVTIKSDDLEAALQVKSGNSSLLKTENTSIRRPSLSGSFNQSGTGNGSSELDAEEKSFATVETSNIIPKKSRKSSIASNVSLMEREDVKISKSPLNVSSSTKWNIDDTSAVDTLVNNVKPNLSNETKSAKKDKNFISVTPNNSLVETSEAPTEKATHADQSSNSDTSSCLELSSRSFKNALDSVRKKTKTKSNVSNSFIHTNLNKSNNSIEVTPLVIGDSSIIKDFSRVNESTMLSPDSDSSKKKKKNVSFSLESNDSAIIDYCDEVKISSKDSNNCIVKPTVNSDTAIINQSDLCNLSSVKNKNNSFNVTGNKSIIGNDTNVEMFTTILNVSVSKKENDSMKEYSLNRDDNTSKILNKSLTPTSSFHATDLNKKRSISISENVDVTTVPSTPTSGSFSKMPNNSFIETSVDIDEAIGENFNQSAVSNSESIKNKKNRNSNSSTSFNVSFNKIDNNVLAKTSLAEEFSVIKEQFKFNSFSTEEDVNVSAEPAISILHSNKKNENKKKEESSHFIQNSFEMRNASADGIFHVGAMSTHKSQIKNIGESSAKKNKNTITDLAKVNVSGTFKNIDNDTNNGSQLQCAINKKNRNILNVTASTEDKHFSMRLDSTLPDDSTFGEPFLTSTEKKKKLKQLQLDSSLPAKIDKGKDESIVLFPEVKMSDMSNQSENEAQSSESTRKKVKPGNQSLNVSGTTVQTSDVKENVAKLLAAEEVDKSASPCYSESLNKSQQKTKKKKRKREHEKHELQSTETEEAKLCLLSSECTEEISNKRKKIKYTNLLEDLATPKHSVKHATKKCMKRKATDELTRETYKTEMKKKSGIRRLPVDIIEQLKPSCKKSRTDFTVKVTSKRKAKPSSHLDRSILDRKPPTCVGKTGQFVTVKKKKIVPSVPLASTSNFGATTLFNVIPLSMRPKNELRMDHLKFHMGTNFKEETLGKRKRVNMQDLLQKQRSQFSKGRIVRK